MLGGARLRKLRRLFDGGSGILADDLPGRGSSGQPLPRDERKRYRPQHGDQQMPIAERPVDDRDHAKQREDRVAQVPAVHSRSTGALAILSSPPRL
jgi:hypothetical protein